MSDNTYIVDTPLAGDIIVDKNGSAQPQLQAFFESIERMINSGNQNSYTVATVPDATQNESSIIYISDESGGKTTAFSDGTNWLRSYDRAIVS